MSISIGPKLLAMLDAGSMFEWLQSGGSDLEAGAKPGPATKMTSAMVHLFGLI